MHKYQPRIHVVKANDEKSITLQEGDDSLSTHIFTETQFMAVTAYQNQQVRLCVCVMSHHPIFLPWEHAAVWWSLDWTCKNMPLNSDS